MPRQLWSLPLEAQSRGLSLAREAQRLLVWTDTHWLFWTNSKGERQAQSHFPSPIVAAAISEDGSAFVVAEADGRLSWLAPDLQPRWERKLKGKPTALAIDPLGLVAAIATNQGQIAFYYADGEPAHEVACPRPAQHLAFVPGTAILIAAADIGWVAAYDLKSHECLWRDSPVATIGGLAVAAKGEPVLLACFSEGLRGYSSSGKPLTTTAHRTPCRGVAVSHDAETIAILQLDGVITGHGNDVAPRFSYRPDASVVDMAMGAFGETLFLAQGNRRVVAIDVRDTAK